MMICRVYISARVNREHFTAQREKENIFYVISPEIFCWYVSAEGLNAERGHDGLFSQVTRETWEVKGHQDIHAGFEH